MHEDETSSLYDSVSFSESEAVSKRAKRTNRSRSTSRACSRVFTRVQNNFDYFLKTTVQIVFIVIIVVYFVLHRFGL